MPEIKMSVSHKLSQDEALRRMKNFIENKVKKEFMDKVSNLREHWDGNNGTFSFSAMGLSVSGSLRVEGSKVELTCKLPWAAGFFIDVDEVKSKIQKEAESVLA